MTSESPLGCKAGCPSLQACSQTIAPHPYRGLQASPEHSGRRLSLRPGDRPAACRFLLATSRPPARRSPAETLGVAARRRHARPAGETKAGCVRLRVRKPGAGGAAPCSPPIVRCARPHAPRASASCWDLPSDARLSGRR